MISANMTQFQCFEDKNYYHKQNYHTELLNWKKNTENSTGLGFVLIQKIPTNQMSVGVFLM